MRPISILLLLAGIVSPSVWGQDNVHRQLYQAFLVEQQGRFDQAIRSMQPLVESNALSGVESGRAWTLLGYAFEELGNFEQSQNAYEKALHILEGDVQHLADYANALDFFAGLYRAMSQPEMAIKMSSKALSIHKQQNDHHGMARTYTTLASIAVEQKHVRSAKTALEKAAAEAKLASDWTDDDHAFICDTQAWIASAAGDIRSELAEYQHSLDLLKHSHGHDFPLTGWAYLLVGKAYAANKQFDQAMTNKREGLTILDHTAGHQNPHYLEGEFLYAQVLDRSGLHAEASRLRAAAKQDWNDLVHRQCVGCTISVASFH